MKSFLPRINIKLSQIQANCSSLTNQFAARGISLMGVSKAVLGEPSIANAMIKGGITQIADSRIENIEKMRLAGVKATFVLLRTCYSQAESTVLNADISLNTEIKTIERLSHFATTHGLTHKVIIMVELGDLREGVMPSSLPGFIRKTCALPGIELQGIGTNMACYGGVIPDQTNMARLSQLVETIEADLDISLKTVSGGNSANFEWFNSTNDVGKINNLRLGESLLLGREAIGRNRVSDLNTQAFQVIAEVIESKIKPSLPTGQVSQNAFGESLAFEDIGIHKRSIVALGRQDVSVGGLTTDETVEILGSSSDHLILNSKNDSLEVGDEVTFDLNYSALLSAMTSPFVTKNLIWGSGNNEPKRHSTHKKLTLVNPRPTKSKLLKVNY